MSILTLAIYALLSGSSYARQTLPSVASPADDKETKEVEQLVEEPKPAKLPFNLYSWIEAGITGNPSAPADNHNFGQLFTARAKDRVQSDFGEISGGVRLALPVTNGLDLKFGNYPDPMTAEGGDPRGNVFYSHSYIFYFGHPGNETGVLSDHQWTLALDSVLEF